MSVRVIAIDGPAGTGKSTVAQEVAKRLGWAYVDTGSLYRGVAYLASKHQVDDELAAADIARNMQCSFSWENGVNRVFIQGQEVSAEIRTEEVGMLASRLSAYPQVRAALLGIQRELGLAKPSVLEGRDIGTIIFPDAEFKFFLSARPETRAQRRLDELKSRGENHHSLDEILNGIKKRDEMDSTRSTAPLIRAKDAKEIDTSDLNVEEVIQSILDHVQGKLDL